MDHSRPNASLFEVPCKKLKQRLGEEGSEVVTKCHQLKLPADDGKMRVTDCAPNAAMFRIIESIPSRKAEPIKQFLARAGAERLGEMAQPSKAIDRAIDYYREKGRDDEWIDHRLQNISARNELTDQWGARGVEKEQYGGLTHDMSVVAMGISPADHKDLKGLRKRDDLRDHMEKPEFAITTLGETAAKAIIVKRDTSAFDETREASLDGAHVARIAREALEKQLSRPVASKHNFLPKPDGSDTQLFAAANNPKEPLTLGSGASAAQAQAEQSNRVIEKASDLGCEDDEDPLDKTVRQAAPAPPLESAKKRKTKKPAK